MSEGFIDGLFYHPDGMRPDDIAGRDVLYPRFVPEPSAELAWLAAISGLGVIARARGYARRRAMNGRSRKPWMT